MTESSPESPGVETLVSTMCSDFLDSVTVVLVCVILHLLSSFLVPIFPSQFKRLGFLTGCVHGSGWILPFQLFPFWGALVHWYCRSSRYLFPMAWLCIRFLTENFCSDVEVLFEYLEYPLNWSSSCCSPVCLRIQVNKENKEFKVRVLMSRFVKAWKSVFLVWNNFFHVQDLSPERAFADFVLCNLVLHLVIMNFLG